MTFKPSMGRLWVTAERQFALSACGLALLTLLLLSLQVVLEGHLTAVVDPAVTHWLATHRSPNATYVLLLVTQVHSTVGINLMLAATALFLGLACHRWREAMWLVVAVESAMLLNVLLKIGFARHRPDIDVPMLHLSTFSFPSGHALAATVFWGCIWLLVPRGLARSVTGLLVILLVALVSTSRVYLGVHYLTDVLAGISEGALCAAAWSFALPAFRAERVRN